MNTLMIHNVEKIKIEEVELLEGCYNLTIKIRQNGTWFDITLFSIYETNLVIR